MCVDSRRIVAGSSALQLFDDLLWGKGIAALSGLHFGEDSEDLITSGHGESLLRDDRSWIGLTCRNENPKHNTAPKSHLLYAAHGAAGPPFVGTESGGSGIMRGRRASSLRDWRPCDRCGPDPPSWRSVGSTGCLSAESPDTNDVCRRCCAMQLSSLDVIGSPVSLLADCDDPLRLAESLADGCNPVGMQRDYGVVEAEGTAGYQSARVSLRAPRVAVRVESRGDWRSMFALAMTAAAGMWGGYGFIYFPRGEQLHPALSRILHAYDPDYLVDAVWTYGDIEAISPGWHARHIRGWPEDADEAADRLARFEDDVVRGDRGEDIGIELCSPYEGPGLFRPLQELSSQGDHMIPRLATVLGGPPRSDFVIPEGLDPLLILALGLRAGYPSRPPLPVGRQAETPAEGLQDRYMQYVLSTRSRNAGGFGGLTTAWDVTQTGLTPIRRPWPPVRPVAVLGSSAADFALAIALDRMFGETIWVPADWAHDAGLRWRLHVAYWDLAHTARANGCQPVVTSISLSGEQLEEAVRVGWPLSEQAQDGRGNPMEISGAAPPDIVPAEELDLAAPQHLACVGDYDFTFTSPSQADGRGGAELLLPVPAFTPRSEQLRGLLRPFWEVDVEPHQPRMPAGRSLRAATFLAGDASPVELIRSGRDGISFHAMSMLLVTSGMTLEQSVTRPRLHIPGLLGWVETLAAQGRPELKVRLSQAGRRATILTRLWGSRAAVVRDLVELDGFLREFGASGARDDEAYPNGDGVRLAPNEGCLTLRAAVRTLPALDEDQVRQHVNHLLRIGVLHRGLVVPCSECERRAFYRIELLGETNACPRCGARAYTDAAWRSELQEPQWFYDLHGAVRELLEQNGDVPFLAGRALAVGTRSFDEIAELDFRLPGQDPAEIDIIALADGRLIVGEAKCVPTLGNRKKAGQAIAKLADVSDLLGADEILLATTAPGPWLERDTRLLLTAVTRRSWRFGTMPTVRVMTNLGDDPQVEVLKNSDTL